METMALGVLVLLATFIVIIVSLSLIGWAGHLKNEKSSDFL
ncbi:hypothetical protein PMI38_02674 [Pseudomonas sp. GM84]|nr:hypothetical protein PMI38_02674 [Pseudomonas sp. GM84]